MDFVGLLGRSEHRGGHDARTAKPHPIHDGGGGGGGGLFIRDLVGGSEHEGEIAAGLLDRFDSLKSEVAHRGQVGMKFVAEHVPGAELLMHEARHQWKRDVPGGFTLGHSVDLSRSTIPGVSGFQMQSMPDGKNYFIGENFGPFHFCCCWMGRGPTYHIIEGNPMDGDEQIQMHSNRLCCCAAPEMDVVTMDGEVFATADEHAFLCCCASTRVAVRGAEHYRITGSIFGACLPCFTTDNCIEDRDNRVVGKIVHWNTGARIEFPEDAKASDKASLLAAVLLTDLRGR